MVGPHYFGEYITVAHPLHQSAGYHKIVYTPADVLLPGFHHIAPPGILYLVRVQGAECVAEAAAEKYGKLFPLLVGKTRTAAVGSGIFQVYLLVGNV